jgi:hypothetical protein
MIMPRTRILSPSPEVSAVSSCVPARGRTNRECHPGKREDDAAEQQAEHHAGPEDDRMYVRQAPLGVAQERRDGGDLRSRGDDPQPVARLQHEGVLGEDIHVAAAHADRLGTETAHEIQFAERAKRLGYQVLMAVRTRGISAGDAVSDGSGARR